jgi:hypothetical protein
MRGQECKELLRCRLTDKIQRHAIVQDDPYDTQCLLVAGILMPYLQMTRPLSNHNRLILQYHNVVCLFMFHGSGARSAIARPKHRSRRLYRCDQTRPGCRPLESNKLFNYVALAACWRRYNRRTMQLQRYNPASGL